MTDQKRLEETKKLMGALLRMPPKPHSDMKLASPKRLPGSNAISAVGQLRTPPFSSPAQKVPGLLLFQSFARLVGRYVRRLPSIPLRAAAVRSPSVKPRPVR